MRAWRGWYHVNGNTYGTWLPGDPRGWRSRHGKVHVDGDYHNPPPAGGGDARLRRSRRLMKRPPVYLASKQRRVAVEALVGRLLLERYDLLAAAVTNVHYHILARFPDDEVRQPVGRAKKHASHELGKLGLPGTVWAVRCRPWPIQDRAHQLNTFHYIVDHIHQGGAVWTFRDGLLGGPPAH